MTKQQKRFVTLNVNEQVRLATPLAKRIVCSGLDDGRNASSATILPNNVSELIGHDGPSDTETGDEALEKVNQCEEAAYALGIAVGLLLRADVFAGGPR
jgi:hypothetical protein